MAKFQKPEALPVRARPTASSTRCRISWGLSPFAKAPQKQASKAPCLHGYEISARNVDLPALQYNGTLVSAVSEDDLN